MGIANITEMKLQEDVVISHNNLLGNHLDFLTQVIAEGKDGKTKSYAANQVSLLIKSLDREVTKYIKMLNGGEDGAN